MDTKNIVLLGHGGCGKTSLIESILYKTGAIDRLGKVADGTSASDFEPDEVARKVSLSLSLMTTQYAGKNFNFLDAPGLFDFAGGQYEGINAADSVLAVVSGKSGVNVSTKKAYRLAKEAKKPIAFFISKLDNENADFYKVLAELKSEFGPSICPVVVPVADGAKLKYIDLIALKAHEYDNNGKIIAASWPEEDHRVEGLIAAISEAVAETDEELFEKYFSGEKFTHQELLKGIYKGIAKGEISPVFCGSGLTGEGVELLLDGFVSLFPNSSDEAKSEPLTAFVFKTVVDPFVGKMSYIKVVSGTLSVSSKPKNQTTGEVERIGKLITLCGKKQMDIENIPAGCIGVATKLTCNTGDILSEKENAEVALIAPPAPCYSMAVAIDENADEAKIAAGLHRLLEEDKTLSFVHNAETRQQVISGLGDQHLETVVVKLKNKFGVNVSLTQPTVAYRETITKSVKVQGRHKKQTGGHGQFGDVHIEFDPIQSEEIEFADKVFGGAVPKGFFPAVEKGIRESSEHGMIAGYPMVGLRATLVDGSYHPVDSSEMSFKMAANIAFREGIPQAAPALLEPIGNLSAFVPESKTGDVMGELNKRRGRVLGMNSAEDGLTEIVADVPMAEMHDFTIYLRQLTGGEGYFALAQDRYEPLPAHMTDVVAAASPYKN